MPPTGTVRALPPVRSQPVVVDHCATTRTQEESLCTANYLSSRYLHRDIISNGVMPLKHGATGNRELGETVLMPLEVRQDREEKAAIRLCTALSGHDRRDYRQLL